jgi:hypothetical protein
MMPFRLPLMAAAALVILAITLSPIHPGYFKPFAVCIACTRRWVADGVLNVWLFVPFGFIVGWSAQSFRKAIMWSLALSIGIEVAQMFMPGRTSAVNDIIFNSIGGAVGGATGVRPGRWLFPEGMTRSLLFASSLIAAACVAVATVILLSPLESQLIPRSIEMRIPATAISRPDEIVPLEDVDVPGSEERFYFGRAGNDFLVRYPTIGSVHGFDQPEYWLRRGVKVPAAADSTSVLLKRERAHWVLAIGDAAPVSLGPTIGQGWTLLAYPESIGRSWGSLLNFVWTAALFFPLALWSHSYLRPVAAGSVVLILVLIPLAAGTSPTTLAEWLGAAASLVLGAVARRLLDQWPPRRGSRPNG